MRTPSLLLVRLPRGAFTAALFLVVQLAAAPPQAAAQSAPPGELTSEDLFDPPVDDPTTASPPTLTTALDPLTLREREAEQAFTDGDLPRALAVYRELAGQHPEASERTRLRVTAAWLLFQLGNTDAASLELTAALAQDPQQRTRLADKAVKLRDRAKE